MNEVARNVAKTQVWLLKAKDGKQIILEIKTKAFNSNLQID